MIKTTSTPPDTATNAGVAGKPASVSRSPAGAAEPPSDEELDRRDRELTAPRPPAGPPLADRPAE